MSTLAVALGEHFFWITSRAAGVAALLASSAAVTLGLLMGGRLTKGRLPDLKVTHEALSLATIAALLIHALALVGDGYLSPSLADVSIPFVWEYQRVWSTLGIVAGWSLIILGLSYYARGRIGPARWRRLHRFTRAGLDPRRRARDRRGHGRGRRVVPGDRRRRRAPGRNSARGAAQSAADCAERGVTRAARRSMPVSSRATASAPTAITMPARSSRK